MAKEKKNVGLYPCPRCQQMTATRLTPSNCIRLVRHSIADRSESCTGSGWAVVEAR